MADVFDYVLLVTAPEAARRKRLSAKVTADGVLAARRPPAARGRQGARSDFVAENVGGRERLKRYVGEVYATILAEGGRRGASPPAR